MSDENVTIIKKKKVSGGHGHHGGAWKVAYADFVTAMMAFFLLMWLLNATTEKQRKGLADYFSPTIPVHRVSGGGDGPFSGNNVFATEELPQSGRGASQKSTTDEKQAKGDTGTSNSAEEADDAQPSEQLGSVSSEEESDFELLQGMLVASSGESDREDPLLQHIRTRVTDEGLIIELFDRPNAPLFEEGSDTPTATLVALLKVISAVAKTVTNPIAITGHSFFELDDARENPNWHLSSNRAQQARRRLIDGGMTEDRVARVAGAADRKPAFDDRSDKRNNRLELTLLR